MRVFLDVPYAEKDQAKALGAQWDHRFRKWLLYNPEDLTPFMRWRPKAEEPKPKKKAKQKLFGFTKGVPMDVCTCDVLPWEDCEHTQYGPDW